MRARQLAVPKEAAAACVCGVRLDTYSSQDVPTYVCFQDSYFYILCL